MATLRRIITTFPKAVALRTIATRAAGVDALHARHSPSRQADHPSPTGVSCTAHRDTTTTSPSFSTSSRPTPDDRTRPQYTTQIYHGQPRPPPRRGLHTTAIATAPTPPNPGTSAKADIPPGPATGAGTGVLIQAHMFGAEVKGNPTESEADVAADRSDLDPLAPGMHHRICLGAGEAGPRPTESEEDVAADRGGVGEDPLGDWWRRKER